MSDTTTVTIRKFGTCADDGNMPRKLDDLINALMQARLEIPQEYWGAAEVDFEPDYECDETYAAMRIYYERPMTQDEAEKHSAEELSHWQGQIQNAQKRIEYCNEQLAHLQ